jgi:hypothetical protein
MARLKIPLIDRLMNMVQMLPEEPGCWIFMGSIARNKYGQIGGDGILGNGKRILYAHRVSYELHRGPIPAGLELDHLCRVRCCVNPYHLEPVTNSENGKRSIPYSNVTIQANKTHCKAGHLFDITNTYIFHGRRYCRTCHNANCRRYRIDDPSTRRPWTHHQPAQS